MTIDKLKRQFGACIRDIYFNTVGLDSLKKINIGQPRTLKAVNNLLETFSEQEIRVLSGVQLYRWRSSRFER